MYDLVIKNGNVILGKECIPVHVDIGINKDKIVCIEKKINAHAIRIINAEALIVAPGFIDMHSHSDLDLIHNPNAVYKIKQGITSEVIGNCGFSLFPVLGEYKKEIFEFLSFLFEGIQKTDLFRSAEQYLKRIRNPIVNVLPLAGHNVLRLSVNGCKKCIRNENLYEMLNLLEIQLKSGISGVSTGLIYPPLHFAARKELIEIGKRIKKYNALFSWHIRNEGDKLEESIQEAIQVAQKTHVSTQISHLKAVNHQNWGKIEKVLSLIEKANLEGNINFDCYPYTFGCTTIIVLLPRDILNQSTDDLIRDLKNTSFCDKIKSSQWFKTSLIKKIPENIVIASSTDNEIIGKSIHEIAKNNDIDAIDVLFNLVISEKGKTNIFLHQMSDDDVQKAIKHPVGFIGTDGIPRITGKSHPRLTNTFPLIINSTVGKKQLLTISEAIKKMSVYPAQKLKLKNRGSIEIGNFADICIFKEMKNNSLESSATDADIIKYVLVNGSITIDNGECNFNAKNGRILLKK